MSLDMRAVEKNLVTIFKTVLTGEEIIISHQNAPRPQGAYTTVKVEDSGTLGQEVVTFQNQVEPDIDLIETVTAQRELRVEINTYGEKARYRAGRLRLLINSTAALELIDQSGLGLGNKSIVRDLTEVIGNRFEERANLEIYFNVIDTEDLVTLTIQTVEIDGEYQEVDHSTQIDIDGP